jgi:hypothetical protein
LLLQPLPTDLTGSLLKKSTRWRRKFLLLRGLLDPTLQLRFRFFAAHLRSGWNTQKKAIQEILGWLN